MSGTVYDKQRDGGDVKEGKVLMVTEIWAIFLSIRFYEKRILCVKPGAVANAPPHPTAHALRQSREINAIVGANDPGGNFERKKWCCGKNYAPGTSSKNPPPKIVCIFRVQPYRLDKTGLDTVQVHRRLLYVVFIISHEIRPPPPPPLITISPLNYFLGPAKYCVVNDVRGVTRIVAPF